MLRVRLDGLPPHKFVEQRQDTRTQAATFNLSADAAATQQMFLEKFGPEVVKTLARVTCRDAGHVRTPSLRQLQTSRSKWVKKQKLA